MTIFGGNAARGGLWGCLVVLAIALTQLAGCDARATKPNAWSTAAALAANDAATTKALATSRLVANARGELVSAGWRDAAKAQGLTFGARVPRDARGAIDVGLATTADVKTGARADFALRVTHEGLAEAPLSIDAGRARYDDVATSTDLLVTADDAKAEWFYVLRDERAPAHFTLHVERGKGITRVVTNRDGSLAFKDARGKTRLAMPAAYAIDARGVKREVRLGWDEARGRLDVAIDAGGLAYPVVVDPSVAVPLWEELSDGTNAVPTARYGAAIAFDSARARTVLFGGNSGAYLADTWEWDGTDWTELQPANAPTAREFASIAYDATRGKIVLFGGEAGAGYVNDTWEWDGTNWLQRTTINAPPVRSSAAMAYDSARGAIVLFGGIAETGNVYTFRDDTWEWDGTSWTQRTPASAPPYRFNATMAYDVARGKSVLYGGVGAGFLDVNDTWEWDGTNWTQRTPATSPSGGEGVLAYEVARQRTVYSDGSSTWEWDGTNWTRQTPANTPSSRMYFAMTYDTTRAETVLYGGSNGYSYDSDTWEWDGTNWTLRAPATRPSTRTGTLMAYDSGRQKTVLAGTYGETWEWDGASWSQRMPATTPSARTEASLAYDRQRGETVLFGGLDTGSFLARADTWEWNGTNWVARTPANAPPARLEASMAYDSARGVTVLFGGGGTPSSNLMNDTWEWNGTTWTQRTPATSPPARFQSEMTYDSARHKTVLFGGSDVTFYPLADTWEWDGTNWTQAMPANPPEARSSASMAYDAVRGKTVLFGGQGLQGVLNDTFEWDGTTWTFSSLPSPSPRTGAGMVFHASRGIFLFGGGSLDDMWLYVVVAGACTTSATCDSGSCVDGVCCAQSSCGACQSCALPGFEGQCTNVAAGAVPTTGDPGACASPNECTASGICASQQGATCASAADCFSGFCVDGVCCDSACDGDCQACSTSRGLTTSGTCAFAPEGTAGRSACANDFACNGKQPSCPAACTDDASCASGYYCAANGTCASQKGEAASCNDAAGSDCLTSGCRECAQGHCVDGACCATCTGNAAIGATCANDAQCASGHCVGETCCNSACAPTEDAGSSTCSQGVCTAATNYECKLPGTTTQCSPQTCASGKLTLAVACDGNGGCPTPANFACPNGLGCASDHTSCNMTCASDSDCQTENGYHCDTTMKACVPGVSCSADGMSEVSSANVVTSCGAYVCGAQGCKTTCESIADCQAGFVCNASSACVVSAGSTPGANASGGCSCEVVRRAGGESAGASWLLVLATATTWGRRRSRRRRIE